VRVLLGIFANANISQKQERFLHVAIPLGVAVIANIIAVSSLNTGARCTFYFSPPLTITNTSTDFAMMLMPGSCYSAAIVILSWITGTLSQPAVKRASAIALINAVCNTPNSKFHLIHSTRRSILT
jgi:hypothetical protein